MALGTVRYAGVIPGRMPGAQARGQDQPMLDRPAGSATATPAPIRGRSMRRRPAGATRAERAEPAPRARGPAPAPRSPCWPMSCCGRLFAFIAIKQLTPQYTAVGSLVYEPSEYKVRELQSILQADPTTEAVMASQAEILRGLRVVQRSWRARQPLRQSRIQPCAPPARPLARAIEAVRAWFRRLRRRQRAARLRRSHPGRQPRRHTVRGAGRRSTRTR